MASVLIVDDSLVMRKNLVSILQQIGYRIAGEAKDGQEAISLYEQLKPDFVTMDLNMPNIDGLDAIKSIMEKDPKARIIVISAVDYKEKVMEAIKLGAKYYILKPVTYEKVQEVLDKISID